MTSAAASGGTDFHRILEAEAKGEMWPNNSMQDVAYQYIKHNPLPEDILGIEEPVYAKLLDRAPIGYESRHGVDYSPEVWLRCTFDLIYRRPDGWVVARDYKTFDKDVTADVDLDFQSRLYTAVLRRRYGNDVEFEFVNVRRTPPNVPKDKAGKWWTPEECYHTVPIYLSGHEVNEIWRESQDAARDLVRARYEKRWYRQPLKSGPHSCGSCFYREMCKMDLAQGGLGPDDLENLSTERAPLVLPEEYIKVNK